MLARFLVLIIILATALVTLSACGSSSLEGTTWKGDTPISDFDMTLSFSSATQCKIGVLGPGGASATYVVQDDEITVNTPDNTYVFVRSGGTMTGGGLSLHKQ
jgi:hypothetical protein